MKRVLYVITLSIIAFSLGGCSYNELTAKQQGVKGKWADVESSLQRRADLIPNLVKTAQMTGVQEQEVFGQIAEARSRLINATGSPPQGEGGTRTAAEKQAILEANNSFGGTIGRLLLLQERYPELRSSEAFMKLQDELSGTENRIDVARRDYNAAATQYNTTRNQFPAVLTATLFGFDEEPLFKAEERASEAPDVGSPDALRRNSQTAPANSEGAPASNSAPSAEN